MTALLVLILILLSETIDTTFGVNQTLRTTGINRVAFRADVNGVVLRSCRIVLENFATGALNADAFVFWVDALLHRSSPFGTYESGGRMYLKPTKIASINCLVAAKHYVKGPKLCGVWCGLRRCHAQKNRLHALVFEAFVLRLSMKAQVVA